MFEEIIKWLAGAEIVAIKLATFMSLVAFLWRLVKHDCFRRAASRQSHASLLNPPPIIIPPEVRLSRSFRGADLSGEFEEFRRHAFPAIVPKELGEDGAIFPARDAGDFHDIGRAERGRDEFLMRLPFGEVWKIAPSIVSEFQAKHRRPPVADAGSNFQDFGAEGDWHVPGLEIGSAFDEEFCLRPGQGFRSAAGEQEARECETFHASSVE